MQEDNKPLLVETSPIYNQQIPYAQNKQNETYAPYQQDGIESPYQQHSHPYLIDHPQHYEYDPNPQNNNGNVVITEEKLAYMLYVMGFFTCFTWKVASIMFPNSNNPEVNKWVKRSKTAFIVGTVALILLCIFIVLIVLWSIKITVDTLPSEQ